METQNFNVKQKKKEKTRKNQVGVLIQIRCYFKARKIENMATSVESHCNNTRIVKKPTGDNVTVHGAYGKLGMRYSVYPLHIVTRILVDSV